MHIIHDSIAMIREVKDKMPPKSFSEKKSGSGFNPEEVKQICNLANSIQVVKKEKKYERTRQI